METVVATSLIETNGKCSSNTETVITETNEKYSNISNEDDEDFFSNIIGFREGSCLFLWRLLI